MKFLKLVFQNPESPDGSNIIRTAGADWGDAEKICTQKTKAALAGGFGIVG
jgi:hypothetical protein